jgi:hypothetical protein
VVVARHNLHVENGRTVKQLYENVLNSVVKVANGL